METTPLETLQLKKENLELKLEQFIFEYPNNKEEIEFFTYEIKQFEKAIDILQTFDLRGEYTTKRLFIDGAK